MVTASDFPHGLFEFNQPTEMTVSESSDQVSVTVTADVFMGVPRACVCACVCTCVNACVLILFLVIDVKKYKKILK